MTFSQEVMLSLLIILLLAVPVMAEEPVTTQKSTPSTATNIDAPAPDTSDVRVLIDVSGSMKKNDPKNLRSPALRLLVGLMPPDSQSAVWNFGQKVTPLVPLGKADEKWKKSAQAASKKIHSRELFTDIGAALEAAISGWKETATPTHKRSVILLTDGMVDISKDQAKNIAERERILKELLPKLQALKVNVHTIALSENVDKEFLEALSQRTDGGFEQTDDPEKLQRIFLHMFEKTTKRDTVPLVNNEFLVDGSIFEMTLLVFRPKGAPETEVVQPDGIVFKRANAPSNVKWQHETSYDLLTITKPMTGQWAVNASTDPDNRVMVVTNLQVQSNRLPNNIFIGERLDFAFNLTENNKIIKDDEFLSLVSLSVNQQGEEVRKRWFLHDNGLRSDKKAHDGVFNLRLNETLKKGQHEFYVKAAGATFERQIQHKLNVYDNILLNSSLELYEQDGVKRHRVSVSPNLEFVLANATKISAKITNEVGEVSDANLLRAGPNQLAWHLDTSSLSVDKHYKVNFLMKTRSRLGRPINYISPTIPLDFSSIKAELPKEQKPLNRVAAISEGMKAAKGGIPEKEQEPEEDEIEIEEFDPQAYEELQKEDDWIWTVVIAVLVNLIVGGGGWFGYKRWRKKRDALLESVTEGLE